jgi:enamine deaminase RidA (YjgF/YER057c/UK114 family)
MARTLISSGSPFEKEVGYSRALVDGDWAFVAGTTGYDPETRVMPESAADQARNALALIARTLDGAGFAMADIVRATYYFTRADYWDEVGPVLGETFGDIRPAASALVVGLIKPEMKVEIEVTALRRR